MGPRRAVAPQCLYDQELSQGEPIPKRPASPSMGWYHHDKLGHGWPTHAQTDDDMESPRCPTSHPSALDDNASEDEERKLSSPISLLDKCSSTRRKVLDSLRWRLEAEKSVKIGEELQFLVLQQQHEISDLRSQLCTTDQHLTADPPVEADQQLELVQLRKDLRQARRDNEALGRRAVAEEERADNNQRTVQVVEQEKRVADQERRALSAKVDQLLRQMAGIKSERDAAVAQLQQSEIDAKEFEEQLERATTLLQAEQELHRALKEASDVNTSKLEHEVTQLKQEMSRARECELEREREQKEALATVMHELDSLRAACTANGSSSSLCLILAGEEEGGRERGREKQTGKEQDAPDDYRTRTMALQEEHATLQEQHNAAALALHCASLEEDCGSTSSLRDALDASNVHLQSTQRASQNEIQALEEALAAVRDECELRRSECAQLFILKEAVKGLRDELGGVKDEGERVAEQCHALEKELDAVNRENIALTQALMAAKEEAHALPGEQAAQHACVVLKERLQTGTAGTLLITAAGDLQVPLQGDDVVESSLVGSSLQQVSETQAAMQEESGRIEGERDRLQEERGRIVGERDRLQEERDGLREAAHECKEERDHFENECKRLAAERDDCELRRRECEDELQSLRAEAESLEALLASAASDRTAYKERFLSLQAECTAHQEKSLSLQGMFESLRAEIATASRECTRLQHERDALRRKLSACDGLSKALMNAAHAAELQELLAQQGAHSARQEEEEEEEDHQMVRVVHVAAARVVAVEGELRLAGEEVVRLREQIVALEGGLRLAGEEVLRLREQMESQNVEAVQLQSLLEEVNDFVEGQAVKMSQHECDLSAVLEQSSISPQPPRAQNPAAAAAAAGDSSDVDAAVADVSPRPVASAGRKDARVDGASAGGDSALSTSYWRHTGRLHVSASLRKHLPLDSSSDSEDEEDAVSDTDAADVCQHRGTETKGSRGGSQGIEHEHTPQALDDSIDTDSLGGSFDSELLWSARTRPMPAAVKTRGILRVKGVTPGPRSPRNYKLGKSAPAGCSASSNELHEQRPPSPLCLSPSQRMAIFKQTRSAGFASKEEGAHDGKGIKERRVLRDVTQSARNANLVASGVASGTI